MRRLRALLATGVLVALVALALSSCGGGASGAGSSGGGEHQQQAKARPLPLYEEALRPGEYHSVKFKPPLSFKLGKGWANNLPQLSAYIELGQQQGEIGYLTFANVKEVFKPGTVNVVEAPIDLVGWLQQHPYLKTSKPQPVTLGGVKGEQLEVLVKDLPQDYNGLCGPDCVDIAPVSNGQQSAVFTHGNKRKVFVLEDVKGDTVMIWFAGPPDTFDTFAPKAQKVIDSVKWGGS